MFAWCGRVPLTCFRNLFKKLGAVKSRPVLIPPPPLASPLLSFSLSFSLWLWLQETSALSDFLRDKGISADYYHAGQGVAERKSVQGAWQRGEVSVVCATIAYGMGIDKPDVR